MVGPVLGVAADRHLGVLVVTLVLLVEPHLGSGRHLARRDAAFGAQSLGEWFAGHCGHGRQYDKGENCDRKPLHAKPSLSVKRVPPKDIEYKDIEYKDIEYKDVEYKDIEYKNTYSCNSASGDAWD